MNAAAIYHIGKTPFTMGLYFAYTVLHALRVDFPKFNPSLYFQS
jgi:hypothetical protein